MVKEIEQKDRKKKTQRKHSTCTTSTTRLEYLGNEHGKRNKNEI